MGRGTLGFQGTCYPRAVGGLRLNTIGNDMQATVPGSVVEFRAKVVGQHLQQLFDEVLQQHKRITVYPISGM